jgi:hypothetical protein
MTSAIQTLTLEEVKAAARKSYDAGRLCAQSDSAPPYALAFGVSRCAIGAALNRTTLGRIRKEGDESCGIGMLADKGYVLLSEPAEQTPIYVIQAAHDNWGELRREGDGDAAKAEQNFLRLIDHPSAA